MSSTRADSIYHHGIIGMKWGVRRYQNYDGTLTPRGEKRYGSVQEIRSKKTGEKLYMAERRHKKGDKDRNFDVLRNGEKVGNVWLEDQGSNLYLNWIDTKKTERGKGYADSVMDYLVVYADKNDYKSMTLEVPKNSPDARHIYEKHGFKAQHENKKQDDDDIWGGLTSMKRSR